MVFGHLVVMMMVAKISKEQVLLEMKNSVHQVLQREHAQRVLLNGFHERSIKGLVSDPFSRGHGCTCNSIHLLTAAAS
jgi:hypothetical protein